jgi:leucyl-tRNA---protein transferase
MLTQLLNLPLIKSTNLDEFLALGWFRMGRAIFTTNFLKFHGKYYSAIWLRIKLVDFQRSKTHLKVLKQNAHFRTEVSPLRFSAEQDDLYKKYRASISFDASPNNQDVMGYQEQGIYDSFQICVYDHQRLIAVGYFDIGQQTAQGICCFYDPDYKAFSLGKLLMYHKIDYCVQQGLDYFYPGYFAPGYPLFDYKTNLAKHHTQFFNVMTNQWHDLIEFDSANTPLLCIQKQLNHLSQLLDREGFEHSVLTYPHFDADMISDLNGQELFDYPAFIHCFKEDESLERAIVFFDLRNQAFHLVQCQLIYQITGPRPEEGIFNQHILKIKKYLFSSISVETMAVVLLQNLKKTII